MTSDRDARLLGIRANRMTFGQMLAGMTRDYLSAIEHAIIRSVAADQDWLLAEVERLEAALTAEQEASSDG